MNLSELRTFLAIVETGSLVRASHSLNVTQSTVTARLKSLEDTLGQTLITRAKSGAQLTPAGLRLKRYAQTITDLWRQARQETALPQGVQTVCNIGCHHDLWPKLGEPLFRSLNAAYPKIAFSIWHGSETDLSNWQANRLIDLFIGYRASAGNLVALPDDELILVSDTKDDRIRFNPTYTYIESGDDFGRQHAVDYADADTARISFNTAMMGLEHLIRNGGSAYLPLRLVADHLEAGKLFKLQNAPMYQRKIYLSLSPESPFQLAEIIEHLNL